jgi:hypothetical protein
MSEGHPPTLLLLDGNASPKATSDFVATPNAAYLASPRIFFNGSEFSNPLRSWHKYKRDERVPAPITLTIDSGGS